MAIEDEIININDIDQGTEILKNDKFIVETNNGTKLIEFKDFVIGVDNISFEDRLNTAKDSGQSTTKFSTITGFNILTNETTAGHTTKYTDISGTVELGKFNYNVASVYAANSATYNDYKADITGLKEQVNSIVADLDDTDLTTVTKTISATNFDVTGGFRLTKDNLAFASAVLNPTTTNKSSTLSFNLNPFSITYPTDTSYVDSYILIAGHFSHDGAAGHVQFQILLDSEPIYTLIDSYTSTHAERSNNNYNFQHIQYIKKGQKLTLACNRKLNSMNVKGFKIA